MSPFKTLPVLFAIDRAGIVGADGQTHQGAFDLSFMRCIPNMIIMTPSDENECRQMLYTGYKCGKPAAGTLSAWKCNRRRINPTYQN